MRIASWTTIAFVSVYGIWCVVSAFLNCVPVAKFWNPSIPGYCLSKPALWFSNAAVHIATDLAILAIPLPALSALELPKRQKIALFAIFALGGLCVPAPSNTQLLTPQQRMHNKYLPPSQLEKDLRLHRPNL